LAPYNFLLSPNAFKSVSLLFPEEIKKFPNEAASASNYESKSKSRRSSIAIASSLPSSPRDTSDATSKDNLARPVSPKPPSSFPSEETFTSPKRKARSKTPVVYEKRKIGKTNSPKSDSAEKRSVEMVESDPNKLLRLQIAEKEKEIKILLQKIKEAQETDGKESENMFV
jgi:hypothetical protein